MMEENTMEELLVEVDSLQSSRPSIDQVNAVVEFMQQHPDLANNKLRDGISRQKAKKLWNEMAKICNAIPGTTKSTQAWMRFWIDKKCMIKSKKKLVDSGKHSTILTPVEEQIWNLCLKDNGNGSAGTTRKKRAVKKEVSDDESSDEVLAKKQKPTAVAFDFEQPPPDYEERQMGVMEQLVQVMDKQAMALSKLAQASASNASAMDRLADASLTQARAVESLASTFANIGAAVHDVRNAIINIDYTLKRCYNINQT